MSLRCAVLGHKYKPFVDSFQVQLQSGPEISVEMKTCERCGKKFFRILGKSSISSSDGKSKVNVQFTFQPKLRGDWDVKQIAK